MPDSPLVASPLTALGLKVDNVVVLSGGAGLTFFLAGVEVVTSVPAAPPAESGPFCKDLIRLSSLSSASVVITLGLDPPAEGALAPLLLK